MMKTINAKLSAKMANMSFVCAVLIVFFHATPAPEANTPFWWFCHVFGREGFCQLAVPYFFLASGFFLGYDWLSNVSKRIKSLIVPFYIWMAIGFVFGVAVAYGKTGVLNFNVKGLSCGDLLLTYIGFHPFVDLGVIWYLRALFILVLLSPFLCWCLKRWKIAVVCFATLYCLFEFRQCYNDGWNFYHFFDRIVSLRGLLYFFVGLILRRTGDYDIGPPRQSFCALLLVIGISLFAAGVFIPQLSPLLAVPVAMLGLFGLMPTRRLPAWLVTNSFSLYLMHNQFLFTSSLLLIKLGIRDLSGGVAEFGIMLFRFVFAVFGALIMANLIKRWVPRMAIVVFGGR